MYLSVSMVGGVVGDGTEAQVDRQTSSCGALDHSGPSDPDGPNSRLRLSLRLWVKRPEMFNDILRKY